MGAVDLFSYREVFLDSPGYRDRDTSRAAAHAMKPRQGTIQAKVLDALAIRPMASFELPAATGVSYRSAQPRVSELLAKGLVKDTGQRREDPETGKMAAVWGLA